MHRPLRRAGIEAELHLFNAATHLMFIAGPESANRTEELQRFVNSIWQRPAA